MTNFTIGYQINRIKIILNDHCINLFVFLSLPCSGVVGDGEEEEVADLGLALGVAVAVGVAKRHHEF
jgi:hypothetical protein